MELSSISQSGGMSLSQEDVLTRDASALAGLVYHAALHVLQEHGKRGRGLREEAWNLAADLEINDDCPFELEEAVLPEAFELTRGRSAEFYYKALVDRATSNPSEGYAHGHCGSGGGWSKPNEVTGSLSAPKTEALIEKAATAITGIAPGGAPGSIIRWARICHPRGAWRAALSQFLRRLIGRCRGSSDYLYGPFSRRQAALGYDIGKPRLPAMISRDPVVAIVIDSSSSMTSIDLEMAAAITQSIVSNMKIIPYVIICDCEVKSITRSSRVEGPFVGGGGTDFSKAFDALGSLIPRPSICIYITDGQGEAPTSPPPGMETLWLLVGENASVPVFQSNKIWGQVVFTCTHSNCVGH
jgi:predicted metal-dependent peptidase